MKKLLSFATLVGISGLVHATTINAPSSLVGANVLNGNNAYSWGISIAVPSGQTVVSAQVDFTGITLTAGNGTGADNLFVDLLNSKTTGVSSPVDNDAAGDYWATQLSGANIMSLGVKTFTAVGQTLSWSYVLNASQLAALNSYLTANSGIFNLGIDPDCHYTVGGLDFQYTLGSSNPKTVPDFASTAFLFVLGVVGLEVLRRRFVAVKA